MLSNPAASWYHSNQYNAETTCEHCEGVVRHEKWCITCDALVRYAYSVASDAEKLTLTDRLILHALGVSWCAGRCQDSCQ